MRRMTNDALHQFLQRYTKLKEDQNLRPGKDTLTNEFQKIKRASEKLLVEGQTISTHGAKEVNRRKNRYKDILPFDHSRVILHGHGGQDNTDYINANYIMSPGGKKGYIASQGPMPSTVNDFWQMIWQHKVKVVVMACKEIELGKHRCQRYWPAEGEHLNFDSIRVTLVKEESITNSLCERTLRAVKGSDCLELVQLHYTAWPDHGVPKTTTDLIHMIELMRERHPWDDPPVLIHCSAGCGRTGVMVAADYGRRLMRKSPESFDVYDLVMMLRKQRPAMVQSKEQYEYLHDVFKDLIEEFLKKPDGQSWSSYMNIDFGESPMDTHLYENIDMIQRSSPQPRRNVFPKNDDTKTFMKIERVADTKKPVITNPIASPQRALINADSCTPKPKPVPRPVKVPNLMDNEMAIQSDSPLQSPLLPFPAPPNQTVELRKPNSKGKHLPQNSTEKSEKRNLKSEKDTSPSAYVNFEIGSSKVLVMPEVSAEKPLLPKTKPEVTFDKHNISSKPLKTSHSADDILKKASPPKPPKKSQLKFEESRSVAEAVIASRPPLPLKLKDLSEFDTILLSEPKGNSNRKENFPNASDNVKPVITKAQTFGRESSESRKAIFDQFKKLSPDYESSAAGFANRVTTANYAVLEFPKSKCATKLGKEDVQGSRSTNEASQPKVADKKITADRLLGSSNGKNQKVSMADEIFTPFEPSSSVRVSPTPGTPAQDGLVRFHGNPITTKENLSPSKQRETGHKASSDSHLFEKLDSLPRNADEMTVQPVKMNDKLVTKTNYLVSIQRTEVKPNVTPQRMPLLHKPKSAESLIENRDLKEVLHTRRFLSEEVGSPLNGQVMHDIASVDAGNQYASVDKRNHHAEDNSTYEVIWPGSKPMQDIPKPRRNSDKPPSLPPRTLESYIFVDENESQANEQQCVQVEASAANDANSEQSSFPWFAVGVDKFKKLTNIKGAFSVGTKSNARQNTQPEVGNSSFYTSPTAKVFPHRLHQKPRGPRQLPNHWTQR